jgi:hypothetical protein
MSATWGPEERSAFWERRAAERREEELRARRERAANARRERELLNKHGFYARLRQVAEGGDKLSQAAKLKTLRLVEREVRWAAPVKQRAAPVDLRERAINRLANDPGATPGERAAALAALKRIRGARQ